MIWLIIFPAMLAGLVVYLTKNLKREYVSSTLIYTGIASGANLADEGIGRVDYFAVNTSFDNLIATIKSRETIEEVGMRLLAQHLIQPRPELSVVNGKSIEKLNGFVPVDLRKALTVAGNYDSTYARVYNMRVSSSNNVVANLLNSNLSHYSVSGILGHLTVNRKQNSDMLELTYQSDDQGVCMHTLRFLTEVSKNRSRSVKGSEANDVVKYFEEQLRKALDALRTAEDRLKNFGVTNRIINYNEQSKFIAESKEDMTTDYYKEVMRFGAAKAAVERLERRLDDRSVVVGNNKDMVEKRRELSIAQAKLANARIYRQPPEVIADMEYVVNELEEELRQIAKLHYKLNNTAESVPIATLVSEWLGKVLEYEESAARITVFEKRLKEYDVIYDEFAPLGSEVTRLTREVDVAEKEYLSVLHGLNLAKLKKQNLQMANSLTVMDEPYLPLVALPSKRMLMVIASFIAGFLLLLTFFVAHEILDHAVRTPEKAAKASGLVLAGAMASFKRNKKNLHLEVLDQSLTEQLVTSTNIALKETEKTTKYYQINIFSARQAEGKTWLCQRLANRFAQIGGKVLYLYPSVSKLGSIEMEENVVMLPYEITGSFVETPDVQALLEGTGHNSFEFSYVFIEIPYLSHTSMPYNLVAQAHVSLLVMNAERTWATAHERVIGLYQKAAKNKVMLVLNQVTPEMLESVYGEIPKRRSPFRRLIKKLVSNGAI
jgi:polysaccharide biosynthesis transport protein